MTDSVFYLTAHHQARVTNRDSSYIDFRTWHSDERVAKDATPYDAKDAPMVVRTSLATVLEAFQVDRATHHVGRQSVKLDLRYDLLMAEGLTLRDFERITIRKLSAILNVRLRVTQERDGDDNPFLQYIIIDKLRVITSPR